MKSLYQKGLVIISVILFFSACKKEDHLPDDPSLTKEEYRYIRLLVSDAVTTSLALVTPFDGSIESFSAAYPNASLYATGNRRFGALVYGSQNYVQFFDCGLEYHGDHVDVKGTPKFASIIAEGLKPTHFKSRGEETLIFNDGDGTLSIAEETVFHANGARMDIIDAGLEPHHGAMAQFDNGTYAVTVKDNTSALSGPHGVKIIDRNGGEVYPVDLAVSRLHGNATDGKNALFGVAGGILVVKDNGEQRIIPNPADFGDIRLGTVLEAAGVNKFVGFVATKGAYYIDISQDKITPIIVNTDIVQCKTDYPGKNLVILESDGTLSLFDLVNGSKIREAKVTEAIASAEVNKPVLEATGKYIYITDPGKGELYQVRTADLSVHKKIAVSDTPVRLAILGYETNESH